MLRIFTDTAANIPPHLLEQYHITAMPLTAVLQSSIRNSANTYN